MPHHRTTYELAVGKLISAIQKEWIRHAGEGEIASQSESVMYRAYDLYKAESQSDLRCLLQGRYIEQYLGSDWVRQHPQIRQHIRHVENAVTPDNPINRAR